MLNMFLCSGRAHVDDYDYNNISSSIVSPSRSLSSRKRAYFGGGSSGGKRRATISKLQIGAPSDFRHETHMGYDEVAGFDIDRYQQELHMRAALPPSPTSPISVTRTSSATAMAVKRKPAPTVPMPSSISTSTDFANDTSAAFAYIAANGSSPTRTRRASQQSSSTSAPPPPANKKPLVPLLGERSTSSDNPNALYVTQTAKLRFDDALAEIEKALKESH